MARRKLALQQETEEPTVDISSLIDISFLLLLYFMVTSAIQPKEADLGMSIPAQSPSKVPFKLDPITLKVDAQGVIWKGTEEISSDPDQRDLPNLVEELERYKEATQGQESKPVVIVSADNDAKHQRLVDVMNTLTKVGIKNVTMTGFQEE
ncbi:MAG: biopolymer transport protein ExbD [Verrucomicrobiales bacterium]|jgi:biopolymer transport protein ExbD